MRIACIIPARGGSKRIPGKNLKVLGGKPLIDWIIESALEAQRVLLKSGLGLDVWVSTEDFDISNHVAPLLQDHIRGFSTVIKRPPALAEDHVPTLPVLLHASKYIKENHDRDYGWCLCLYPTSPFLSPDRIVHACRIIGASQKVKWNSLVSVVPDGGHFWTYTGRFYPDSEEKFAKGPKSLYRENGAIYGFRVPNETGLLVPPRTRFLVMDEWENIDIDTPDDWAMAKLLMAKRLEQQELEDLPPAWYKPPEVDH